MIPQKVQNNTGKNKTAISLKSSAIGLQIYDRIQPNYTVICAIYTDNVSRIQRYTVYTCMLSYCDHFMVPLLVLVSNNTSVPDANNRLHTPV